MTLEVYDNEHERLDSFLARRVKFLSRTKIASMIKDGLVTVDGDEAKPSYKLSIGEIIDIELPEFQKVEAEPEDIPIEVVHEEDDFLVVNKPQGMLTHPAGSTRTGTLVNAMLHHCKGKLSGMVGTERPGIVHRLDKGTSGLMVVAKDDMAMKHLARLFKERKISKHYVAICKGYLSSSRLIINAPIGRDMNFRWKMSITNDGRSAISRVIELERLNQFTFVEVKPETGRTHQIRVHLSYIGHPILSDSTYGGADSRFDFEYPFLHCRQLTFELFGRQYDFNIDPPKVFQETLQKLRLTKS
ncbi:MAG TPA: RluA family pseudouridine synthase [Caldisericia bacterium]|nr:RluA family pseudouridine synthase [Caldisericia bacterium]HPF48889.1 RluA family pseudouridine synthase [Caldisericia bacterium]HPI83247.1 RluA family pseudouridine synthase [Caldisericia bacterium]HPQ92474.1 RluA family pseudouridine synthase [Caldisericia bacterium]HRV74428.1 RluA family pseudouridine synthase [Caldisericia bacterium]